jgi:hypothetical protein
MLPVHFCNIFVDVQVIGGAGDHGHQVVIFVPYFIAENLVTLAYFKAGIILDL